MKYVAAVVNKETKIIYRHIIFYEQKFSKILDTDISIQKTVLGWLSIARQKNRVNKIKDALIALLNVHDIYFEHIPSLTAKPWSEDFEALLVKYNLERD